MSELYFRSPSMEDCGQLREYLNEHYANNEMSVSCSMGLENTDFTHWVYEMNRNTLVPNDDWGCSSLLICFEENEIIGLLSVRYELSEELHTRYGDIGYGVRPSRRRQGYATRILRYGLHVCREHGLREVLVGCHKDNIASVRTICKNKGELLYESTESDDGRVAQYFRIVL